jgi:hypothetical protein
MGENIKNRRRYLIFGKFTHEFCQKLKIPRKLAVITDF